MIARYWRGIAIPDEAANYISHLEKETFPALKNIPGFQNAMVMRIDRDKGVEFVVLTFWDSIEVIKQFAGEEITLAVVPEKAREMLIEFDKEVKHYDLVLQI